MAENDYGSMSDLLFQTRKTGDDVFFFGRSQIADRK